MCRVQGFCFTRHFVRIKYRTAISMKLDIYDFDKTVVPFDSGSRFWAYCLLRYPWTVIFLPYQFVCAMLLVFGVFDLTRVKRSFFSFIRVIPLEKAVKKFWDRHEKEVHEWAKKENRARFSVIISASPDFLLDELVSKLGFDALICTRHDAKTGAVIGKNCKGDEKIRRFREQFPDAEVITVYSDSIKHDKPIFSLGSECVHIDNGKRVPFEFKKMYS